MLGSRDGARDAARSIPHTVPSYPSIELRPRLSPASCHSSSPFIGFLAATLGAAGAAEYRAAAVENAAEDEDARAERTTTRETEANIVSSVEFWARVVFPTL